MAEERTARTANRPMALRTMLDCFFSSASKKKAFHLLTPYWTAMLAMTRAMVARVSSHAWRRVGPDQ